MLLYDRYRGTTFESIVSDAGLSRVQSQMRTNIEFALLLPLILGEAPPRAQPSSFMKEVI